MRATELIHQLNLAIAEAGGDPEVLINGEECCYVAHDPDSGTILIETLEPCAICGGPTTMADAYEAGIGDAICSGCR